MDIVITTLLLIIVAEVTYLLAKQSSKISTKSRRPIFVDTSVLIDGRIVAIAQSGFIGDILMIPRSVIGELQYLADNADHEKRSRARHGLDVVRELQTMPSVSVEIFQDGSQAKEGVDERLLTLAKKHNGAVCTIDFNLNKVAQVENIEVLNVNELAKTLRMAYLPGETLRIELTQKGQDGHQAVGHLPDGTMVVVEQASKQIGSIVEVEFIRSLQTAAGRMMFAKLVSTVKPVPLSPAQSKKLVPGVKQKVKGMKPQTTTPPQQRTRDDQRENVKPSRRPAKSPRTSKPKTQAEREASLIELVNNQD